MSLKVMSRSNTVSVARASAFMMLILSVVAAVIVGGFSVPALAADDAVPSGFQPASTSWISANEGWILGLELCMSASGHCLGLMHTKNAGESWQHQTLNDIALPDFVDAPRIYFANRTDGLISTGTSLFATHTGKLWKKAELPDLSDPVSIGAIASNRAFSYAVVTFGSGETAKTRLYSSPLHKTSWNAVPGIEVLGAGGGGSIAANGLSAYVDLGIPFENNHYWTENGRSFVERPAPCSVDAVTRLNSPIDHRVMALCSEDPGMGNMAKELKVSVNNGPFTTAGNAPVLGITMGFAAASPSTAAIAAVGRGVGVVHATFDGGQTWETPLTLNEDLPASDLAFQDATHGVVVFGGPGFAKTVIYRTTDGGHSWAPLEIPGVAA